MDDLNFKLPDISMVDSLAEFCAVGNESDLILYKEKLAKRIKENSVLVMEENDEVVGILIWQDNFLGRTGKWFIEQIQIREDKWRKGHATIIQNEFFKLAKEKGITKIFADLNPKNTNSLNLAIKTGWTICGTFKGIGNLRLLIRFDL